MSSGRKYEPTWESLDSRPTPQWFDDCKLGIFCHWGVYSVPAYKSEWFWWKWRGEKPESDVVAYANSHYPTGATYADFARDFTADDFDAGRFAEIVKASGARYFVMVAKHHDGYTLWPSATAPQWNSVDVGPKRDLVGEMKAGIEASGLRFGLYLSLYEWFHPLYLRDAKTGCRDFPETVTIPQLHELVDTYKPEIIWPDGDWDRPEEYWRSRDFIAWLYNESAVKDTVAISDRWGSETIGKHGGYHTYADRFNPQGRLLPHKWENCLSLDRESWGFRREMAASDVLSVRELVAELVSTISCGGNLLLNIGPDRHGRIVPIFEERLRDLGKFVTANEEAIFGTKPWIRQREANGEVWYTSRLRDEAGHDPSRLYNPQTVENTVVYAFVMDIPDELSVKLEAVKGAKKTKVSMLGATEKGLEVKTASDGTLIVDLHMPWSKWPSKEAIVLKIEYAEESSFIPTFN